MVHRIFPKAAFFPIHLAADRLTMHFCTRHSAGSAHPGLTRLPALSADAGVGVGDVGVGPGAGLRLGLIRLRLRLPRRRQPQQRS
jgi:hypothetical protein